MKVSILICAYNSGKYIFPTIESILNQTFSDYELLVLDNNSTDDTVKNIRSFSDGRIKLFESQENLGPYGGLNYLLEKAQGKYIAILDHDDLWAKEKLEKQIDFLNKNKEFIGCGTKTVMYYESDSQFFEYYLQEKNYYTIHSSLMFRKGDYRYDDSILYFADGFFQKHILCKGQKCIYNLNETLTFHLIKDNFHNLSYSWFQLNSKNIRRVFDLHGFTFYAFFALIYEISRYFIIRLKIAKGFPQFFKWFDRIPYKFVGSGFQDFTRSPFQGIFPQK